MAPTLAALAPDSVELGWPSFTLHALGSGFTPACVILWNGSAEPTLYVGPGEVTTGVNMLTATTATSVPVSVQDVDTSEETAALVFTFTDANYPVSPFDVALVLGIGPDDPKLAQATTAANQAVRMDLDQPFPVPCPEPIRTAVLGCAVDLYRLPSTAFGYFVNDVGIASTGTDVMRRWRALLDPYRVSWGIA